MRRRGWRVRGSRTRLTAMTNGQGLITAATLRYLLINRLKRDYQLVYPDGNSSTDAFAAYTTSFAITGKVGGVFEASMEWSNDNAPSLV